MSVKFLPFLIFILLISCRMEPNTELKTSVYQSSAEGDLFELRQQEAIEGPFDESLQIDPKIEYQSILGFGGAFTESSAFLLQKLSAEKREEVLQAYFSPSGANYSLCRTHINSCDFSLDHYSYAEVENDTVLEHFDISHDKEFLIPTILRAREISKDGFKLIASPWTAPPWMKDNKDWNGGKLLKEFYPSWALYFEKYLKAYAKEKVPIWGLTVENEPLGNDANWESMHYTAEEMADFVKNYLGPQMEKAGLTPKVLIYDQNRGKELEDWAKILLTDDSLAPYIHGTAVHWYNSTIDWMPASLNYTHELAPNKYIIQTEGCVDAEVPKWKDNAWYWSKEATDWGWDWAKEEDKKDHPKYVPVYRYARDMIGCLNSWVEGWIDWNMVLDKQGGPNLAKNWCAAPVLVDTLTDEVYYTPLYYTMKHFSKFIRPGAKRIEIKGMHDELQYTAVKNADESIVLVILNTQNRENRIQLQLGEKTKTVQIDAQALQTIVINN